MGQVAKRLDRIEQEIKGLIHLRCLLQHIPDDLVQFPATLVAYEQNGCAFFSLEVGNMKDWKTVRHFFGEEIGRTRDEPDEGNGERRWYYNWGEATVCLKLCPDGITCRRVVVDRTKTTYLYNTYKIVCDEGE